MRQGLWGVALVPWRSPTSLGLTPIPKSSGFAAVVVPTPCDFSLVCYRLAARYFGLSQSSGCRTGEATIKTEFSRGAHNRYPQAAIVDFSSPVSRHPQWQNLFGE